MRIAPLALLVLAAALPAATVTAGGDGFKRPPVDEEQKARTAPAWIADPTEGGKIKGTVASWANGASKEEQKKARAEASAKLLELHKLPATNRVKEMNLWIEASGKTYVHLVAR